MPAIIPRTVALADGVDILVGTFTADELHTIDNYEDYFYAPIMVDRYIIRKVSNRLLKLHPTHKTRYSTEITYRYIESLNL